MSTYTELIRFEIKDWVSKKITENPKRYGTHKGNAYIIKDYLLEVHSGTRVENLSIEAISTSVAVSRARNLFLKANPEFDSRGRK